MMDRRAVLIATAGLATLAAPPAGAASPQRRVAALFSLAASDEEALARLAAFRGGLEAHGWVEGRNLALETGFAAGSLDRLRKVADELLGRKPEVVLAAATTALAALKQATDRVPIVFAQVTDPVGAGFVTSLARPGGNITGVTQHEFSIGAKWLELVRELSPGMMRVGVLFDPTNPATAGYLRAIEGAATQLGTTVAPLPVGGSAEIAGAIAHLGGGPAAGLIVLPGPVGPNNRQQIIALTLQQRIPAVFPFRYYVTSGGLASYGISNVDLYRQAAWFVDRILKGDRPAELPVQHAARFQLVVNAVTAKALGLTLPPAILLRADEVIE